MAKRTQQESCRQLVPWTDEDFLLVWPSAVSLVLDPELGAGLELWLLTCSALD